MPCEKNKVEVFSSEAGVESFSNGAEKTMGGLLYRSKVPEVLGIEQGDRVGDIGCGGGNMVGLVLRKKPSVYFAVDRSKEMLKELRENWAPYIQNRQIIWQQKDITKYSSIHAESDKVDKAFACGLLFYLPFNEFFKSILYVSSILPIGGKFCFNLISGDLFEQQTIGLINSQKNSWIKLQPTLTKKFLKPGFFLAKFFPEIVENTFQPPYEMKHTNREGNSYNALVYRYTKADIEYIFESLGFEMRHSEEIPVLPEHLQQSQYYGNEFGYNGVSLYVVEKVSKSGFKEE